MNSRIPKQKSHSIMKTINKMPSLVYHILVGSSYSKNLQKDCIYHIRAIIPQEDIVGNALEMAQSYSCILSCFDLLLPS